eukprot:1074110_1
MSRKKHKQTFTAHPQYHDILILHKPRRTLAQFIESIAEDPGNIRTSHDKEYLLRTTFDSWKPHHLPYLLSLYLQLYLRKQISKQFKYDPYIDTYYAQIPTVADVQQQYRPYLHHIALQLPPYIRWNLLLDKIYVYMNKPIRHGPVLTLSLNERDLLIFGYIHEFQIKNHFYAQTIPWDVIKVIHSFHDTINKQYLSALNDIKHNIIDIESEIQGLKTGTNKQQNTDVIHAKQSRLLTLYNMTKDVYLCEEEFEPYLLNKYVIDTKQYQLSVKQFVEEIDKLSFRSFQNIFHLHHEVSWWPTLHLKPFLFDLLKRIVPRDAHCHVFNITHTAEIEAQFAIYEDYIQLFIYNISVEAHFTETQQIYNNLTKWILEMFQQENAWTKRINNRVNQLTQLNKQTHEFDRSVSQMGKSYTID